MPQDKHGSDIHVGDIVDLSYGGDNHTGEVTHIEKIGDDVHILHATVTATVPSGLAKLNPEETRKHRHVRKTADKTPHTTPKGK